MPHVHFCAWCGTGKEAPSATMLEPSCSTCGCALKACTVSEWPAIHAALTDTKVPGVHRRGDGMSMLVAITAGPWLLPILGVELGDVTFVAPFILFFFAAAQCLQAATYSYRRRHAWRLYSASAAFGAASCAVAVVASIFDRSLDPAAFLALIGAMVGLAGVVVHTQPRFLEAPFDRVLDGALVVVVVAAPSIFFAVLPALSGGEILRTAVMIAALISFAWAGVAAVADPDRAERQVTRRVWAGTGFLALAYAFGALGGAGELPRHPWIVAMLGAGSAAMLALAALQDRPRSETGSRRRPDTHRARWLAVRVMAPMSTMIVLPIMFAVGVAVHGSVTWPAVWFGIAFVASVGLIFYRQAHLLLDHRRAVVEERTQRQEANRRNEELEALTGLATTMTQTLEEAPIVEQALSVLHLAARASSSALHVRDEGRLRLRASTGDWQSEHPWADRAAFGDGVTVEVRGGRQITRLPLSARDQDIGVVTLIRPKSNPLRDRDLELLRLLVDQMAVAVQNARDYREKLEQAVRDPLTGLYNRRYFFEALEKEVQRSKRYGSTMALVLIDVDDFKRVNDTLGHAAGDDVLRGVARAIGPLLRPTDSCARIGGEEFALLLPETEQLDALIVAERVRTAIGRQPVITGHRVTVSAGVGACPQDADEREDLVKRIDDALYWAKRNGKDMCAVVSDATDAGAEQAVRDPEDALAHLVTLVAAIDAQQLHTRDHSENVAMYAFGIGQALSFPRERLMRLRRAALLHDVGKVAVRPEVLEKPARLTDSEYAEIKLHPSVGATMLRHAGLIEEAAWVRHHHERVDGHGYPGGLSGDDIPLEARIIFICDSFEAMTSDRPYQKGKPVEVALEELRRCAGTQFDERIVDAFAGLIERGKISASPLRDEAPAPEGADTAQR